MANDGERESGVGVVHDTAAARFVVDPLPGGSDRG